MKEEELIKLWGKGEDESDSSEEKMNASDTSESHIINTDK